MTPSRHDRKCSICKDPKVSEINELILSKEKTEEELAQELQVTLGTVQRHIKFLEEIKPINRKFNNVEFLEEIQKRSLDGVDVKYNPSDGVKATLALEEIKRKNKEKEDARSPIERALEQLGSLSEERIDVLISRVEGTIKRFEDIAQVVEGSEGTKE